HRTEYPKWHDARRGALRGHACVRWHRANQGAVPRSTRLGLAGAIVARRALRRARAHEVARIFCRYDTFAGPRHRGEYGRFQSNERRFAEDAAGERSATTRYLQLDL